MRCTRGADGPHAVVRWAICSSAARCSATPSLETAMDPPLGSGEAAGEPLAEGDGTWTLPQPATTSATSIATRARDLITMLRGIHAGGLSRSTPGLPGAGGDARIEAARE